MISGSNCWTEAIAQVKTCAPGLEVIGKLASDGRTCSYPNGDHATLSASATALDLNTPFSFELTHQGSLCAGFSLETNPASGVGDVRTLRTALGEASWTYGATVSLSCPDGTVYETDSLSALQCHGFGEALGFVYASARTAFRFSFIGKPTNVDVLSCEM